MARALMFTVKHESIRAFLRGLRTFEVFGIKLTIQHAHDNEWQILLPDKDEILRLIYSTTGRVELYEV